MANILQYITEKVNQLSPQSLVVLGLITLILGLFFWLGGLGYRKTLIAILAAAVFAAVTYLFITTDLLLVFIAAPIGSIVALFLERIFITMLSLALAVLIAFLILYRYNPTEQPLNITQIIKTLPTINWIVIAVAAIIILALTLFLYKFTAALLYATVGTVFIAAAMTLLLTYKGSQPLEKFAANPALYYTIIIAMIAFGTLEQVLLCSIKTRKPNLKQ